MAARKWVMWTWIVVGWGLLFAVEHNSGIHSLILVFLLPLALATLFTSACALYRYLRHKPLGSRPLKIFLVIFPIVWVNQMFCGILMFDPFPGQTESFLYQYCRVTLDYPLEAIGPFGRWVSLLADAHIPYRH